MGNLRQFKTPKPFPAIAKSSMRSFRGKRSLFHKQQQRRFRNQLKSTRKLQTIRIIRKSANYTRLMMMMMIRWKKVKSLGS